VESKHFREYLCKIESQFKNILGRLPVIQGVLFAEKTEGRKFRGTVPLMPKAWPILHFLVNVPLTEHMFRFFLFLQIGSTPKTELYYGMGILPSRKFGQPGQNCNS
jgi:hypothetical protein